MRDFYKQILKHSHQIWGRHQLNTIYKDKTPEEGDQDLVYLLDGLCRVSQIYSYIPEEAQKDIINKCLITEEYENINMKDVSGWLRKHGEKYFKEVAHVETKVEGEIVTGEKRDKYINDLLSAIAKTEQKFTSPGESGHKGSGTRMRENIEKSSGLKTFHIDGMDVVAFTEEEAIQQRKQIV